MNWLQRVFTPRTSDENLRRQGFLVMVVSVAMTVLALSLATSTVFTSQSVLTTVLTLSGTVIYVACATMAHYGRVRPAALLIAWFPAVGVAVNLLQNPNPTGIAFLCIPLVLASLVLSSVQLVPLALVTVGLALYAARSGAAIDPGPYYSTFFLVLMVGAMAYLSAWSVERALWRIRDAGLALERANQALHGSNSELEARVEQRTAELQQREQTLQQAFAEQQATLAELRMTQEAIRELSAPILPVAAGVLVAPLVGAIDSARSTVLMNGVLGAVEQERARLLILDVTGVPVIDTSVARILIQTGHAVKLLGAQLILTGIRPEVAQTLVGLGVDLSQIVTRGTLESGLAEALTRQLAPTTNGADRRG